MGYLAVTHSSLKIFPSVCQREQKQNALTQPSPWRLHHTKMVTWSPTTQLRRGWWRRALHPSCVSLTWQTTDPPRRAINRVLWTGILIFKRLFFFQSHFFWQHLGELASKSNYRLPMSEERRRGYGSRAEPKQWPHELQGTKISTKKAYLPVKTAPQVRFEKMGQEESSKHQLSQRNCVQRWSGAGFCLCPGDGRTRRAADLQSDAHILQFQNKRLLTSIFPSFIKKRGFGGSWFWFLFFFF